MWIPSSLWNRDPALYPCRFTGGVMGVCSCSLHDYISALWTWRRLCVSASHVGGILQEYGVTRGGNSK